MNESRSAKKKPIENQQNTLKFCVGFINNSGKRGKKVLSQYISNILDILPVNPFLSGIIKLPVDLSNFI